MRISKRIMKTFGFSAIVFALVELSAPQLVGADCGWKITQLSKELARSVVSFAANDVWVCAYTNLYHWNGEQWLVVAQPPAPANADRVIFFSISGTSDRDLWLVGRATRAGITFPFADHFNGTNWRQVPVPPDSAYGCSLDELISVRAFATNDAWAFEGLCNGKYLVALHWDGSQWTDVSTFEANGFYGWGNGNSDSFIAASSDHDFWVVGSELVHFDGRQWSSSRPRYFHGFLSGAYARTPTDAWAVGIRQISGGQDNLYRTLTYHWNGVKWSEFPSPNHDGVVNRYQNVLDSVSGTGPNNVWAVGGYYGGPKQAGMALHWNGRRWLFASPLHRFPLEALIVDALAPNDVLAFGYGAYVASYCH